MIGCRSLQWTPIRALCLDDDDDDDDAEGSLKISVVHQPLGLTQKGTYYLMLASASYALLPQVFLLLRVENVLTSPVYHKTQLLAPPAAAVVAAVGVVRQGGVVLTSGPSGFVITFAAEALTISSLDSETFLFILEWYNVMNNQ
ncbi:hypothetical protein E2C01_020772 [Portunus trituberculatus]|uniref:Uncharacterized protein n=1 Tax=Portunus trituberculatus TaxID=210409 RepID=A0A5B7E2N7_PORTR|nr:hypothetical protein [Portunus trituberculatus]